MKSQANSHDCASNIIATLIVTFFPKVGDVTRLISKVDYRWGNKLQAQIALGMPKRWGVEGTTNPKGSLPNFYKYIIF